MELYGLEEVIEKDEKHTHQIKRQNFMSCFQQDFSITNTRMIKIQRVQNTHR